MSQFESLCIVKKRDDFAEPTLYRIGDIQDDIISQAYYEKMPVTIGNKKGEEKKVESIQVRAWKPREDDERKNDSVQIDLSVYEVIFVNNDLYKEYDESIIRQLFYHGIDIPEGLDNNFLLALPGDDQLRTAIVCNTRDFVREGNRLFLREDCSDLLHIKPCFDMITIADDEIISTKPLYERVSTFDSDEIRYFFKFLDIDDLKTGLFKAYPLEKYASNYVKTFLTRRKKELEITKKDINALTDVFDDLAQEHSLLDYFATTGYSIEDIKSVIKNNASIVVTELMGMDDRSLFVKDLLKQDFSFNADCIKIAKEEWLSTADEDRERVELELKNLNDQKKKIEYECENLKRDRTRLAEEIETTGKKLSSLTDQKQFVEKEIDQKLTSFQNNVVEIAFAQAISAKNVISQGAEVEAFTINNHPEKKDEIDDIYELAEILSENLVIGGIKESYSYDCAYYLISSIMIKRGIILPATISQYIADAISNSIDACDASIIICPNSYDLNSLATSLTDIDSRVVLIKNCIDVIRGDLLEILKIGCDDKIIICDFNNSTNLKYMPSSIRKQVSIITDDSLMIPRIYPKYEESYVENKVLKTTIAENAVNERFRLFKKELQNMIEIDDYGLYTACIIETVINEIIATKTMLNIFNITSEPHVIEDEEEFERWLQEFLGEEKTQYILKQMK